MQILTVKMLTTLNLVGFWLVIVITHYLVKGEDRVKVLGWICLVLSVSSFAAPLSIMVIMQNHIYPQLFFLASILNI